MQRIAIIGVALLCAVAVTADDGGAQPVCDAVSVSDAVSRSLAWLEAHPRDWPDDGEKVGAYGLSLWPVRQRDFIA